MARRGDPIAKQIRAARKALREVSRVLAKFAVALKRRKPAPTTRGRAEAPRRRPRLTPERLAQLKLHGAYIGHLRHLKPRQRAEVKAIKAKKGYEAAIRLAKRVANR